MKIEVCVKIDNEFRRIILYNIQNIFFKNQIILFNTIYSDTSRVHLDEKNNVEFKFGGTPEKPT
jgi:hypothetical protein